MANSYRYNVVIEIGIETNGVKSGQSQVNSALSNYEKQAIESAKRINAEYQRTASLHDNLTSSYETNSRRIQRASQETAQVFKASNDLMNQWSNERSVREAENARKSQVQFKLAEEQKRAEFQKTVSNIESQGFDKIFFRSKEASAEFRKELEKIGIESKKITINDVLGKTGDYALKANLQTKAFREELQRVLALETQLANAQGRQAFNASSVSRSSNASQETPSLFTPSSAMSFGSNQVLSANNLNRTIGNLDPFQSANNQSFAQAKANLTSFKTFENDIKRLDPFQSANNVKLSQTMAEIEKSTGKASNALGQFGSAFKGAFVGAIAGTALRTLFEIPKAFVEIAENSILVASSFERTSNAFTALAGDSATARHELSQLADLARNTNGLGLETAEQGALRLRSVGFEAEQSRDLLEGLSKVKVLSGAPQESLDRFLYNLTQVRSAGKLTGMELRDALRELPAIAPVLKNVFGTISAEKIRGFGLTSDEFFKLLISGLKEVKEVSAGTEDSMQKFKDAWLEAERTLGQPSLEPTKQFFKDLTILVNENKDAMTEWGYVLAGVIKLADYGINGQKKNTSPSAFYTDTLPSIANRTAVGVATGGLSEIIRGNLYATAQIGKSAQLGGSAIDAKQLGMKSLQAENDVEKRREETFKEVQKKKKQGRETELNDIEGFYRTQTALVNQGLTNTTQAEYDKEVKRTDLAKREAKERIAVMEASLAETKKNQELEIASTPKRVRDLTEGRTREANRQTNALEQSKIDKERGKLLIDEIDNSNKLLQLKQRIRDEERQAKIEAQSIKSTDIQQNLSKQTFEIERAIERQGEAYSNGYNDLIQITNDAFVKQSDVIRQQLAIQLVDEKLTEEQRVNLKAESNLKLENLEEQNRQKMLEIGDKQFKAQIERFQSYQVQMSGSYKGLIDAYSAIGGLFNPSTYSSNLGAKIPDALSSRSQRNALQSQIEQGKQLEKQFKFPTPEEIAKLNEQQKADLKNTEQAYYGAVAGTNAYIKALGILEDSIPKSFPQFEQLNKEILGGNIQAFDEAQRKALAYKQRLEREDLGLSIRTEGDIIDQATIDKNQVVVLEHTLTLKRLIREQSQLGVKQTTEQIELEKTLLDGLTSDIENLRSGEKGTITGLKRLFEGDRLEGIKAQYKEIYKLQYQIATSPYIDSLKIQQAYLTDIVALQGKETDNLIRQNSARLEISQKLVYSKTEADAKLLEFFAQQKGLTDIISDSNINLLTSAYSQLDKVAESLGKHFGFASDMATQLISSLAKLAVNWVFQKMTGLDMNGSNGSGGGFNIGGIGKGSSGSQGSANPIQNIFSQIFGGGNGQANTNSNGGLFGGSQGNGIWNLIDSRGVNSPTGSIINLPNGGGLAMNVNGANPLDSALDNAKGLLGQGATKASSASSITGGLGLAGIASMLPFLGGGIGASLGAKLNGNMLSKILGIAGGAGVGVGAGLIGGGLLMGGLAGITTAITGVATLGLSALPLVAAILISRSAKRRKEEVIHNDAMLKGLSDLDKIIEGVNNNTIDASSAMSQADAVKAQYITSVSAITDKKTKNIAMSASELGRLDTKIQQVKDAIGNQKKRQERQDLLVPTFADGGFVGYKHNPLGYQVAMGTSRSDSNMGYFPSAGRYARYANSEYILDAETTRNIGIPNLDRMRLSKGKDMPVMGNTGFAEGGALVATSGNNAGTSSNNSASGATVNLELNIGLALEQFLEIVKSEILKTDGSEESMLRLNATLNKLGDNALVNTLVKQIQPKLR